MNDDVHVIKDNTPKLASSLKVWYDKFKKMELEHDLVLEKSDGEKLYTDLYELSKIIASEMHHPLRVFEWFPHLGNLMNLVSVHPSVLKNQVLYDAMISVLIPLTRISSPDQQLTKMKIWALHIIKNTICPSSKETYEAASLFGSDITKCYNTHCKKMSEEAKIIFESRIQSPDLPIASKVLKMTEEYPDVLFPMLETIIPWLSQIPPSDSQKIWCDITRIVYTKNAHLVLSNDALIILWTNHRSSLEKELLKLLGRYISCDKYSQMSVLIDLLTTEKLVRVAAMNKTIFTALSSMLDDIQTKCETDFHLQKFMTAFYQGVRYQTKDAINHDLFPQFLQPLVNILDTTLYKDEILPPSAIKLQLDLICDIMSTNKGENELRKTHSLSLVYPEWLPVSLCFILGRDVSTADSYKSAIQLLHWYKQSYVTEGQDFLELLGSLKKLECQSSLQFSDIKILNKIPIHNKPVLDMILTAFLIFTKNGHLFTNAILQWVCGSDENYFSHLHVVMDMVDLCELRKNNFTEQIGKVLGYILDNIQSSPPRQLSSYEESLMAAALDIKRTMVAPSSC